MSFFPHSSNVGVSLLTALALCGCSGKTDRPTTYSVSGQVAYQQKPVEGASVSFWAEGASRAAQGTTDKDGKFTLSTFELNDGAIEGTHKVTVVKSPPGAAPAAAAPVAGSDPMELTKVYRATIAANAKPTKPALPAKYALPSTTPIEAVVKAGDNEPFVFQLTE